MGSSRKKRPTSCTHPLHVCRPNKTELCCRIGASESQARRPKKPETRLQSPHNNRPRHRLRNRIQSSKKKRKEGFTEGSGFQRTLCGLRNVTSHATEGSLDERQVKRGKESTQKIKVLRGRGSREKIVKLQEKKGNIGNTFGDGSDGLLRPLIIIMEGSLDRKKKRSSEPGLQRKKFFLGERTSHQTPGRETRTQLPGEI